MADESVHEYSNGEIAIVWKPGHCIHSGNCVRGLPAVFNVKRRPWIDASAADTQAMIEQVGKSLWCPVVPAGGGNGIPFVVGGR